MRVPEGDDAAELLFTPAIDRDTLVLFLRQIARSDPDALHVIIQDQAGFDLQTADPCLPPNLRLLPLSPCCPELNPVERPGGLIKAQVCNRLYPTLAGLERYIEAVAKACLQPANVASLIHNWLLDQVNESVPAYSIKAKGVWYQGACPAPSCEIVTRRKIVLVLPAVLVLLQIFPIPSKPRMKNENDP